MSDTVDLKFKVPGRLANAKKRDITIVLGILLAVAAIAAAYTVLVKPPILTWDYRGQPLGFRVDLREAAKVPVYPSDVLVYRGIMNPLVENVTIAFKDAGEKENPYYILEEMEIIPKMTLAYAFMLGTQTTNDTYVPASATPGFKAINVTGYANLPGKIQDPIIALVHPMYANETSVRMDGHVVYISGRTKEDFDKATVRFLMVVLGIDPKDVGGGS